MRTLSTPTPDSTYTDLPAASNTSKPGVTPPQARPRHRCVLMLVAVTRRFTGAPRWYEEWSVRTEYRKKPLVAVSSVARCAAWIASAVPVAPATARTHKTIGNRRGYQCLLMPVETRQRKRSVHGGALWAASRAWIRATTARPAVALIG